MCRSALILLLAPFTLASNYMSYLDPVVLQSYADPETQTNAALEIINKYTANVIIDVDPRVFQDNKDTFHLRIKNGVLYINASTGVAAVWGFNHYLKKYCKSQIEWQTTNVRIPDPMPSIIGTETIVANDRLRYYQNVCTASYSFAWWDIMDWQKHLDWMALNGINLVLAPIAQEAAWTRVYYRLGMTREDIDEHFTGPAFLSWLRMGNVRGWGGPLPQSWHDLQTRIQNVIIERMVNLGMVVVRPAFNGHVPRAFSRIYPNSTIHKVGQWNHFDENYCCGSFLDPNDPMFEVIGQMFNEESLKGIDRLRSISHIYTADPFNEVKVEHFTSTLAQDTARAVYAIISKYDDSAVWLLQNWMFVSDPLIWPRDRVKSFLTSLPSGRILVLDLQAEQWPQYDLYDMYYGQPFIWCMLHNFGGTLGMFGNIVTINRDVYEVRTRVNSTMIGIGLTPEGINQNYVVYDLMLESAWRKGPVQDLDAWAAEYAERRYGCNSTAEAWKYLLKSVYSFDGLNRVRGKYVVTRRPSFKIKPWAWYRSHDLFEAFKKLIFQEDSNCNTEGYLYDVVDVTRQALQYRAEQIYMNVANDRYTNLFVFKDSVAQFLDVLNDLSDILSENVHFHGIEWFSKARKIGITEDEEYLYQMNARNQVTLWGPNGEISDYACKQWAVLFRDYYYPRWSMFLSAAVKAKESGEVFDEKATRRVVMDNAEIPFMFTDRQSVDWTYNYDRTMKTSKKLYRKWVYLPSVQDLPVIVIKRNPDGKTTMADVEVDDTYTPDAPSVVTSPTPTGS